MRPEFLLGSVENMHRLSFGVVGDMKATWVSIIRVLKLSSVMNNLEELNLIVRPPNIGRITRGTSSGIRSFLHNDLDRILESLPKFCRMKIYVDSDDFIDTDSQEEFQLLIAKQLPLIYETKYISISFTRNFDWCILL